MSHNAYNMPHKAYSRASLTTAKTRQVVMLYDGIIRNLMQAQHALDNKNPEQRFERMMKASEIVMTLQSSLDMDGDSEIAQRLNDYYTGLDSQIIRNLNANDSDAIQTIIDDVRNMRKAWDIIDQGDAATIAPSAANDAGDMTA